LLFAPGVASVAFPVIAAVAFIGKFSLSLWAMVTGLDVVARTTRLSQNLQ
jgi:hypothetical protein